MKRIISLVTLLFAAGVGQVHGQELPSPRAYESVVQAEASEASPGPSPWIRYTHNRPECCGPIGGDGPIVMEIYLRTGPSIPIGGGRLADSLNTGWTWAAGGRSLFYNVEHTAAWTADLGISHTYNNAGRPDIQFVIPEEIDFGPLIDPIVIPVQADARTLNRTFANLSVGREHYRLGSGFDNGRMMRMGWDVGTRLGASRLELNVDGFQTDYERLGSFAYGFFAAAHSDIEFTRGCCVWFVGARFEIGPTYTHFRHINSNEIWDVNLLGTMGVRY